MARAIDRRANRRHVVRDAARRIGVHDEDRGDLALRIGAQRFFDGRRIDRIAGAIGRANRGRARAFELQRPLLGKVPGRRNERRFAVRDKVLRDRLPRAVAVRGVHEELGAGGLEQPPQSRLDVGDDRVEPRVRMVHRLAVHRIQHFDGDMGGPRRVQQALTGDVRGQCLVELHAVRRVLSGLIARSLYKQRELLSPPGCHSPGRSEMERQDPYIGTGTLPPTREERSGRPVIVWIIVAVVVLGATVVAYFLWARDAAPPTAPERAAAPAAAQFPVAHAPQHPLEKEPTEQPLPELKASDGPVAAALSALVGLDAFGQLFLSENLVRNIVATVDNLPSEKVSQRMNPVRSVPGVPATTGKGEALALAPANAARYAPYIRLAESVSTDRLVAFYRRHYPLFQQAYVELGYPNGYFNDRLVEAIDHP